MIKCQLCGHEMKGLTLHLHYTHKMKPAEYTEMFPDAVMFSKEVLSGDTFGGRSMKGKQREKSFTEEHRNKISEARKKITGWTHKPETIEKMKASWHGPNRETRCEAARESQMRPEVRAKKSKRAKERIERDGYHLKRGKRTSLEKLIESALESNGIEFHREKRSASKIDGVYRYFDFFIPDLDLIIEVDGEFWHRQPGRMDIDRQKEADAKSIVSKFLRLSDAFSKDVLADQTKLLSLIFASADEIEDHTRRVISSREESLAPSVAPVSA